MPEKIITHIKSIEGWPIDMVKAHLKDNKVKKEIRVKIINTIESYNKSNPIDGAPCQDCGCTMFIRTGTCSVCTLCGTSQGCS